MVSASSIVKRLKLDPYLVILLGGIILLLVGSVLVFILYRHHQNKVAESPSTETHSKHEETPPETFVMLEMFSEALESSVGGVGVKIAELAPKVEHINEMYQHGETHKAFAKTLGIATEVVLLGFFIETFGIAELFISALSLQDNWLPQMIQSLAGVMISTKIALLVGEKVEEAAEHQYEHEVQAEAKGVHY